ncbi:MAG: hypothetical protein H0X66_16265 [Verrucomicrobia bacterium]|nr:hypothetical protein [Verrucomicrobiota bacterium]
MRNLLSIFSFKNRNQFAAIGLFIAMVIVLETAFAFLPQNSLMTSFNVNRTLPNPAPDFQIMGDSVAQGGLIADQLQEYLPPGKTVYNYALGGTGPEFPYFILKRQIKAGSAPKNIIYGPSPHTFHSKRVALLVGAFCDWGESWDVVMSRKEPFEAVYGGVCKLSYTFRHREPIRELLKKPAPLFPKLVLREQNEMPSAGIAAERHYSEEDLHPMYKRGFKVLSFNRHYFEKFLDLAQQNGIQVYWVTMPVLPVVAESRKNVLFDAAYFAFLEEAQKRFGIKLLQKEFLVFEDQDFKDFTHLDIPAAERFTKIVGEKLSNLPPATVRNSAKR